MVLQMIKPKTLTDREIAIAQAEAAMAGLQSLSLAYSAANNPDLKRMYESFMSEAQAGLAAIQTYVADQGYANPFASPDEQLKGALDYLDGVMGGQQTSE